MSHNTVALKKETITYKTTSTFNWAYIYNGGNRTNQTATAYANYLIRNISLDADVLKVSALTAPEIITTSSIPLSKDRFYHHTIMFFSEIDRPESTFSTANCPRAKNTIIDKCEIKELSRENYIQNIRQYPDPYGVGMFEAGIGANANNIQMLEIWGHGTTDNVTNLNSLTYFDTWFYILQNTSSTLTSPVNLTIYLSPIEIYTEEESAEEQAAEKELEGTTNIENQTPQNTTGGTSENQQTTSIIGTISSFVGAFSNISPAQNCEMVLPFPDFVGGNQTVDICQGKDKAPAVITIASSLLLIVTFVPVAFIVLSMIYREIRSFTNG